MTWHAAGLRRLDRIIWALVVGVAGFVLIAAAFGDLTIVLKSYVAPASVCLLLMLGVRYYRDHRDDPNIASALESTAQLIAFAAVAAPLSYVAASAALPLQDKALGSMDHSLGFDWVGWLAIMNRWPVLFKAMHVIYQSASVQMIAVVLLLGFTGRLVWLRVYMLAFIFAALITIAISAVLPAEGAWLHYGFKDATTGMPLSHTSWPIFFGLRDGSFRSLMAIGSDGIITFPSLHAALAVILAVAFWPAPMARWVGVGINSLMLVATPIDGSHYFVDVLAGIGTAVLCLAAARALAARLAVAPAAVASRALHVSAVAPSKPKVRSDRATIPAPAVAARDMR